jgi:hypothetical protein
MSKQKPIEQDEIIKELTEEFSSVELLEEFYQKIEKIRSLARKNIKKHNVSAGVELRHELRSMKTIIEKLVKITYDDDKQVIQERRNKRQNEFG